MWAAVQSQKNPTAHAPAPPSGNPQVRGPEQAPLSLSTLPSPCAHVMASNRNALSLDRVVHYYSGPWRVPKSGSKKEPP